MCAPDGLLVKKTHENGASIAGYMEKQLKSIQVRQSQWDLVSQKRRVSYFYLI